MSDEGHFHISEIVNKQPLRYRAREDPHLTHQRPLYSENVTIWCVHDMLASLDHNFTRKTGPDSVNFGSHIRMILIIKKESMTRAQC